MQTEVPAAAPARTEEMAVIHRIFRRGFPRMADLVRQTPTGATSRSEPIAEHLDFLLNGLHNHHSGEDENIWPRLLERAAPQAELIARMEKQHEVVAERSERVRTLLQSWRRSPVDSEALATALDEFTAALVEHLDDEEAHVVPLLRVHITAEEWTRFGQAAFEKFTNAEKLVATGTLEEVATPEEVRWFLDDLPLPIKLMWRLLGRRKYSRYMRRVEGRGNGKEMRSARAAALVTWIYAGAFGIPAIPVAVHLRDRGELPTFNGLFEMYGGPWSSRFDQDLFVALLIAFLLVVVVASWLAWLVRNGSKAGAVLSLLLLPIEAVFWVGFALPFPWLMGLARAALTVGAWRSFGAPQEEVAGAEPTSSSGRSDVPSHRLDSV